MTSTTSKLLIISPGNEIQPKATRKEDYGNCILGPYMCASSGFPWPWWRVNAKRCYGTLESTRHAIGCQKSGFQRPSIVILRENSRFHTASRNCDWPLRAGQLREHGSPSLQPRSRDHQFHLCGFFNKHLTGKQFATEADVKQAVTSWILIIYTYLFLRPDESDGDSVGQTAETSTVIMWRSDVYHLLAMWHARYTSESEYIYRHQSACYIIFFLEFHCKLEHGDSRLVIHRDDHLGV